MKLKPKLNMTLFKGFLICLVLFVLIIIAFFGFKAYPNIWSDIGVTQKIDSIFHKSEDNKEKNTNPATNNNEEKKETEN